MWVDMCTGTCLCACAHIEAWGWCWQPCFNNDHSPTLLIKKGPLNQTHSLLSYLVQENLCLWLSKLESQASHCTQELLSLRNLPSPCAGYFKAECHVAQDGINFCYIVQVGLELLIFLPLFPKFQTSVTYPVLLYIWKYMHRQRNLDKNLHTQINEGGLLHVLTISTLLTKWPSDFLF